MENANFLYKDCGGMSPNDKEYADAFKYVYTKSLSIISKV